MENHDFIPIVAPLYNYQTYQILDDGLCVTLLWSDGFGRNQELLYNMKKELSN